ncbi:MAG: GGDEF domain-containing protein [Acidimicrobiaceae bacterium]|nr:GGDEF domain-containing protein [Acidimicrobiaceae bacterium]
MTINSDASLAEMHRFVDPSYEPWLFQTMIEELATNELGIGFIYSVLEQLAKRYDLKDAVVVLEHESLATQEFRLGGNGVGADRASVLCAVPGVYCEPDVVPQNELEAVRTACQLALALHLARFTAAHDALTTIANRRTFDIALANSAVRSARYGWAFTLVLIDLKEFKVVNDRFGHEGGDRLLRHFGFALRQSVRQGDLAARIGGDEFAVILNNAEGHEAMGFVERLRENLAKAGETIEFTTGTSTSPRDSTDPAELTRIADARLYAKRGIIHR